MKVLALVTALSSIVWTMGMGEDLVITESSLNGRTLDQASSSYNNVLSAPRQLQDDMDGNGGDEPEYVEEYDDDDDDDDFPEDFETCDMKCENNGTCELLQMDNQHKHVMEQKCNCLEGYGGVLCEKEVEVCFTAFGADRYCQNEAPCRIDNSNDMAFCNCLEAYHISAFAGLDCSYPATEYCTENGRMSHRSFCTNNGECKGYVTYDDPHPGCKCPKGFHGEYCEYLKGENKERVEEEPSDDSNAYKWLFAILIITYVASLSALIIMVRRWRERTLAERAIVEKANFVTSELTMRCVGGAQAPVPGVPPPPSSFTHTSNNSFSQPGHAYDDATVPLAPGQESKELNEHMADLL